MTYHAPTTRQQLKVSVEVFSVARDQCFECVGADTESLCDEHNLCQWFVRHALKLQAEIDKEAL